MKVYIICTESDEYAHNIICEDWLFVFKSRAEAQTFADDHPDDYFGDVVILEFQLYP